MILCNKPYIIQLCYLWKYKTFYIVVFTSHDVSSREEPVNHLTIRLLSLFRSQYGLRAKNSSTPDMNVLAKIHDREVLQKPKYLLQSALPRKSHTW